MSSKGGTKKDLLKTIERLQHENEILRRKTETGWLIERNDKGTPYWLTSNGTVFDWTTNATNALRFGRRFDALIFMKHHGLNQDNYQATEHTWED